MADQIFVQVRFSEETKYGAYEDALYFTPEEYAVLDSKVIEQIKKERIDNWTVAIETTPPKPEQTKEELFLNLELLAAEKLRLEEETAKIQSKITEIESKEISALPESDTEIRKK